MRAYFAFFAPKSSAHKPSVSVLIPVDGFFVGAARPFSDIATKAEWEDFSGWYIQSPPTLEDAQRFLVHGITAGGVPVREWAVEVPSKIYTNPLNNIPLTDPRAPVTKWLADTLREFDGADPLVGTPVAAMLKSDQEEHMRLRARHAESDALGAIALRRPDAAPDPKNPKVSPMKGRPTYERPNGETYYARKWGEHTDIEVLRKAREEGINIYFSSVPGTGKTAAVEAAFSHDLYTVVGSINTEVSDLMGGWVDNGDGTHSWVDGPAVRAAEEGKPLYVDEGGLIDPRVMSSIYPLMDGRGEVEITANPARAKVVANPGFIVIVTTNPKAPGVRMSEALLSRLDLQAEMTTDYKILENEIGVNPAMCRVAENLSRKQKLEEISWAPQFRELLTYHKTERIFGTQFALRNMLATVPEQDRDEVSQALSGSMGQVIKAAEIV